MSYGHKNDFQDGGRRHVEFQKFQFLVTWLRSGSPFAVVYRISSKSDNFSLRYSDLTILEMAAVRILDFKNLQFLSCNHCQYAVLLPHIKFRYNWTIGWWAMAKKERFSRWRPPPSWILKISIFGHVTVIGFNIYCSVLNFIKIGRFFTEIWRFYDFQNGGRPPSCSL